MRLIGFGKGIQVTVTLYIRTINGCVGLLFVLNK